MGRTKSQEWEYVIQVKALGKGQFTCQCRYCSHKFDGGTSCIRAHILGFPCYGVSPCGKVPNNVKEIVKKSIGHADVGISNVPNGDDIVDDLGIDHASNDTQNVHGHVDLEESGKASKNVHPSSSKKRKLSQQALSKAWNVEACKKAKIALRRFFYAEGIPFWKVRDPYFKEMVSAIGHAGLAFIAPSFYALRKTELNDEIKVIASDLNVIKEKWRKYGCTIVYDGWSNTRHRSIINFLVASIHGTIFLKSSDTSGHQKSAIDSACKIVKFVTRKEKVLALFRSLSSRDLIKLAPTRFAYYYIIENLLDDRCLQKLRKSLLADHMIEKLQSMDGVDESKLNEIKTLCIDRWDMMHTPLHAVGFMLHPIWKHKNQESDVEVHEGWIKFLEKYCHRNVKLMGDSMEDYDKYKNDYDSFASPVVHDPRRMQEGVKWWEMFGGCTPKLKSLAIRVLSQGSCASPCERNWRTYSLIYTKRRNRLLPCNANKLVYIHTNLRLLSKVKERGFERMEITLDMLNKEKDEDHLLALQNMREAEIGPMDVDLMKLPILIHNH
ncbi:hypothetical protein KP509_19G039100 [Ceratopteris richardii]|uniref:Uncharacterized protein n=1 Tax=Ceratopteris richardii TaxID=49495 RepID=A0A8T2SMR5_CERRI|nr:hypothetical protein KP509_19G039100 [Ceratopteris richardii]